MKQEIVIALALFCAGAAAGLGVAIHMNRPRPSLAPPQYCECDNRCVPVTGDFLRLLAIIEAQREALEAADRIDIADRRSFELYQAARLHARELAE